MCVRARTNMHAHEQGACVFRHVRMGSHVYTCTLVRKGEGTDSVCTCESWVWAITQQHTHMHVRACVGMCKQVKAWEAYMHVQCRHVNT